MKFLIKNKSEIRNMKTAGKCLTKVLKILKTNVKPGINVLELDKIAYNEIIKNNCKPSFLHYEGFPNTICISINHVLIHGIPNDYILKNGDLVSIDCGCSFNNYHSDAAFTIICGTKSNIRQKKIINVTKNALDNAIKIIKPNISLISIAEVIEKTIVSEGYFIPSEYTGHGIGKKLHEFPYVHNLKKFAIDFKLKSGMVIAIEPMVLEGSDEIFLDSENKWAVYGLKNYYSCHFEKTVLITDTGYEILGQ